MPGRPAVRRSAPGAGAAGGRRGAPRGRRRTVARGPAAVVRRYPLRPRPDRRAGFRLKDFARLDRAFSEEVDLNDCVRNAVLIARTAIKDKAEISSQLGELPLIACAPSQINQVLLNLLTNAAQAMERFGRILLKSWADERQVFLSVQDNGKGMPAEVLGRIFDPFFTTKPVGQGTGLGLSISYKIIQQHGGTIRVASEPGRGTRFLISLPREQARELKRSA
ncbi:GHKL domain-containing protein [Pseudomonas aeruginosa]|nr:GHKL domain-containing protein [Pseudomonas aeruginosa]